MRAEKKKKFSEGKSKILFETTQRDLFIQFFKDDATAFNALKKGIIKDKGIVNNSVSSWVFRFLEKNRIPTHFVDQLSDREMLVKRVDIIPVEVVVRNRATGSIVKRLGLEKGTTFVPPLLEFFYKSDELGDPLIAETHILHFKWATREELTRMTDYTFRVNLLLQSVFNEVGLELIDFKLEYGRDSRGELLLADEFTPDGCRLWDRKTGEPMDKDRFRQDLGGVAEAYQEVYQRLSKYFRSALN